MTDAEPLRGQAEAIVTEFSELFQEWGSLFDLERRESGAKAELIASFVRAQQAVGGPLNLKLSSLGSKFPKVKSVRIEGESLVFRPEHKREKVALRLADLDPELFNEIASEAARVMEGRAVHARDTHVAEVAPSLAVSVRRSTGRVSFLSGYSLVFSNVGGDAVGLTAVARLDGKRLTYGPSDVPKGVNWAFQLGSLRGHEEGEDIPVAVVCKDSEGRAYSAEVRVPLVHAKWQPVGLSPAADVDDAE